MFRRIFEKWTRHEGFDSSPLRSHEQIDIFEKFPTLLFEQRSLFVIPFFQQIHRNATWLRKFPLRGDFSLYSRFFLFNPLKMQRNPFKINRIDFIINRTEKEKFFSKIEIESRRWLKKKERKKKSKGEEKKNPLVEGRSVGARRVRFVGAGEGSS